MSHNASGPPGFAIDLSSRAALLAAFKETHAREELRLTARRSLRPGDRYRLHLKLPPELGTASVEAVVMGVSPGPGGLDDERVVIDLRIVDAPGGFMARVRQTLGLEPGGEVSSDVFTSEELNQAIFTSGTFRAPDSAALAQQPARPPDTEALLRSGSYSAVPPGGPPIATPGPPSQTGVPPVNPALAPQPAQSPLSGVPSMPSLPATPARPVQPSSTGLPATPARPTAPSATGMPAAAPVQPSGIGMPAARPQAPSATSLPVIPAAAPEGSPLTGQVTANFPGVPNAFPTPGSGAMSLPFAGPGGASAPLIAGRRHPQVEAFTVSLTKALTNPGNYDGDTPEVRRVREKLHQELEAITQSGIPSVTFSRADNDIEFGEHGRLAKLMTRGRAELFVPKLLAFMERRGLRALGFTPEMSAEEFGAFLSVISAPTSSRETAKADISIGFDSRGVTHAITRFDGDLITGEALSSPAQIVLGRLGSDLRSLPLFKQADSPESRALKEGHLRDILRPITEPTDLRDILLNADRLEDAWQQGASGGWSLVDAIASALPHSQRVRASDAIASFYLSERDRASHAADPSFQGREPRLRMVLGRLASIFLEQRTTDSDRALRRIQENRLIGFDDLNQEVRDRLAAGKVADGLLKNAPATLAAFRECADAEAYRRSVGAFRRAVPELIRREEFVTLRQLLAVAAEHAMPAGATFPARPMLARELLKAVATPTHVKELLEVAPRMRPAMRGELVQALASLGPQASATVLRLADQLSVETEENAVERALAETVVHTLTAMGPGALPVIRRTLEAGGQGAAVRTPGLRRAVAVALGEAKDPGAAPALELLSRDPNPQVREAALRATVKLKGAGANEDVLQSLVDPDPQVQRSAVAVLLASGSRDPRAIDFYRRVLQSTAESAEHDALMQEVCNAITSLAQSRVPEAAELETAIIAELEREPRMRGRGGTRFKLMVATPLTAFGVESVRARRYLQRLSTDKEPEVRRAAKSAMASAGISMG